MRICLRKERKHWIKIRDYCHIQTSDGVAAERIKLERERAMLVEYTGETYVAERRLNEREFVIDICEAAVWEEHDVETHNVSWRRNRLNELENAYNAITKIDELLEEDRRVAYPDDDGCAEGISDYRYYAK